MFLFFLPSIFSEVILLKSGETVEGKIIEKTDKSLKVDIANVPLTYYIEDIESIDGKNIDNLENNQSNSSLKTASESNHQANLQDTKNIDTIRSSVHSSKTDILELVSFQPKLIDFPFKIKYPAKWYAREEGSTSLFLTREPVNKMEDRYRVGVGIYYIKGYFLRKAPPDSEFSGTAKNVYLSNDWTEEKKNFIESHKKLGVLILSTSDLEMSGYPAVKINFQTKDSLVTAYFIKMDWDVINLVCEAPKDEYANYSKIFEAIMESFRIESVR